jgi:hypothetical protein
MPIVEAELSRQSVPLPRELVLSVIDIESDGVPGIVNPHSGASGLMQVMPGTLDEYNKHNKQISLSELRDKSPIGAVSQIRVGTWVLSQYWRNAHNYLSSKVGQVAIDDLGRIADLFYAAGAGATKTRLNQLTQPSWIALEARFPKWKALVHPRRVFGLLEGLSWPIESISEWLKTTQSMPILKTPQGGLAIGSILILLTWWYFQQKEKSHG